MPSDSAPTCEAFRVLSGGELPLGREASAGPTPLGCGTYDRSRSLLELPGSSNGSSAEPLRAHCTPRIAEAIVRMVLARGGIERALDVDFRAVRKALIEACAPVSLVRAPGRWQSLDVGVFEALGEGARAAWWWHALLISPSERLAAAFALHVAGGKLASTSAPLSTYLLELVPGVRERRVGPVFLRAGAQVHVEAPEVPPVFAEDPFLLVRRIPRRFRRFVAPSETEAATTAA